MSYSVTEFDSTVSYFLISFFLIFLFFLRNHFLSYYFLFLSYFLYIKNENNNEQC